MNTEADLLEKMKRLTGDDLRRLGIRHEELMKIITLLENDQLPLDAKERGGYRIITPCIGQPERSVTGPGMLHHDVPLFPSEYAAEAMCRCLGRAYTAGQRNRSAVINELLKDAQRR